LERIAEAAIKVGQEAMRRAAPDLPFEQVRGLGNVLRHAYAKPRSREGKRRSPPGLSGIPTPNPPAEAIRRLIERGGRGARGSWCQARSWHVPGA
jgi:hypothetical protein